MHAELERVGLHVIDDTIPAQWAERYGGARDRVLSVDEHLAVALK
jgi:hypothetical protein